MEVYKANDCIVISDEIWSDIILEGYKHTPTQSVSDWARQNTVAVYAPSKTFNLAGLVGSYHIIYNKYLRDRVVAKSSKPHYNDMNVLSMHALIGAYKPEGYEWVDELRQVITGNVDYACEYIRTHFEGVEVSRPQGTYMLFWIAPNGAISTARPSTSWKSRLGCGRSMAGWADVPRPLRHPHESGAAAEPRKRSLRPSG